MAKIRNQIRTTRRGAGHRTRSPARQHGVISVTAAPRARADRFAIGAAWRARSRFTRSTAAGLLRRARARLSARGSVPRGRHGLLDRGPVLSHRSAADLWGLRPNAAYTARGAPSHRATTSPGYRCTAPACSTRVDFTVVDGIPVTSVARTLLDLVAVLRPSDLIVAIDRAERQGIFDLTAVVEVLSRARGRKGARALQACDRRLRAQHPEERARAALQATSREQARHPDAPPSMPWSKERQPPTRSMPSGRPSGSPSRSTASSSTAPAATASATPRATPTSSSAASG